MEAYSEKFAWEDQKKKIMKTSQIQMLPAE
jgi:hypothetical protein